MDVKAIIFDLDGVLADSHGIINGLFAGLVREELGIKLTDKEFGQWSGLRFEARIKLIARQRGIIVTDQRAKDIIGKGREEYYNAKSRHVRLFPGVAGVLETLSKDYLLAVGTNGSRNSAIRLLTELGIVSYFKAVVTFDDVDNGKPAPDIFRKAAMLLKADAAECVVVEDSVEGVEAALAAGMPCIAVTTTKAREELAKANLIIEDIASLPLALGRL